MSTHDARLAAIGRAPPSGKTDVQLDEPIFSSSSSSFEKEKEKEKPVKRKRGRPRKEKPPPAVEVEPEEVDMAFPMGNDVFSTQMNSYGDEEEGVMHIETNTPDELARKTHLVGTIAALKNRLNAEGSGLNATVYQSEDALQAEIELLNDEINARRGDKAMKSITLTIITPAIEKLCDMFVPKKDMDVSGLSEQVDSHWDELFHEAATQIAINNRQWLNIGNGPYAQFGQGMMQCMQLQAVKNRAIAAKNRRRQAEEQAVNFSSPSS